MARKPCEAKTVINDLELQCDRDKNHPAETPHVASVPGSTVRVVWNS
jgi:hypothetical protein